MTSIIWSWVPRWTTFPWSSTMISSQSRMVLSRWATIRQVQPRRRRLSSTALLGRRDPGRWWPRPAPACVGCQRQRPGDLQPLALAAAEVAAALLDRAAVAAGAGDDVLVDAGVPGRLDQVGVGDGGVPQGQVVAHGALEQADVLVHHRQRADQRAARGMSARGCPSNRISPLQGACRPATSRATVLLPDPEPPTSATRCPAAG